MDQRAGAVIGGRDALHRHDPFGKRGRRHRPWRVAQHVMDQPEAFTRVKPSVARPLLSEADLIGSDVRIKQLHRRIEMGQTGGVCHTDLHAANGDWPVKPTPPFIPGHEGIGQVASVGSGVTIVKEGDQVGVPWLYSACGHCEYCLSAWETVCPEAEFGGYTKNGGFAEYIIGAPDYVAHIPAGLGAKEAAPLIFAGITTYKGIKMTEARPGEWVVISGAGGLGHLGIQYARAMGLQVCAVDIDEGKLAHAKRLGADLVVNAAQGDPAEAVKKGTDGGAHGVLITAPSLGAFKQGVGMTRKRGTCVLVGLPPGDFPLPLFDVVANCITVRGSFVGTREDMAETLAFAAQGKVKADIELQPLSAINDVFTRLEHGDVPSRVVLDFAAS